MTAEGVTVTGQGSAAGPTDLARLTFAAEASTVEAQAAVAHATAGLEGVRSALVAAGVAVADLASTQMFLHTQEGRHGEVRFVARFGLVATLRDLQAVGRMLATALAAGGAAARLDGVAFDVTDRTALARAARDAAFADARAKAEQFAMLAGRGLGPVVEVVEGSGRPAARSSARPARGDGRARAGAGRRGAAGGQRRGDRELGLVLTAQVRAARAP